MSGPYGTANDWSGSAGGHSRTSGLATLALGAGISSFFCLFGVGGLAAIVLGVVAHSEIERSEGRLSGKGLASTGVGLGIANLVLSVVGLAVLVAFAVRAPAAPVARTATPPPAAVPLGPSKPAVTPQAEASAEPDLTFPKLPGHVGAIAIIEAAAGGDRLDSQLLKQLKESAKSGERVIVWTVAPGCEPCDAVGRALPDPRMQRALSGVRLVRVAVTDFQLELRKLGVPVDETPGFALLDAQGRALDYIHGGEWDADIPANIAPILSRFLRRDLAARRHPWSRPLRAGETPL